MLSKLGKRNPNLPLTPFDMVRCTFDGLLDVIENGFHRPGVYIPLPSNEDSTPAYTKPHFVPDAASIWLLFRSQHACFTHFDLNRPEAMGVIQQRIDAWETFLSPRIAENPGTGIVSPKPSGIQRFSIFRKQEKQQQAVSAAQRRGPPSLPDRVTFLRTIMAENPEEELSLVPRFHQVIRERTKGTLKFRTVMVMHDQDPVTRPMCYFPEEEKHFNSPCVVWNLKRERSEKVSEGGGAREPSLLDQCHAGYERIINTMSSSPSDWDQLIHRQNLPSFNMYVHQRKQDVKKLNTSVGSVVEGGSTTNEESGMRVFTPYRELSRVCGLPAVRGTCTGFGSTYSSVQPGDPCPTCGSVDGHALQSTGLVFDTHRSWTDDDVGELLLAFAMSGGDEVATVEAVAQQQGRGGNETWLKLREIISQE